MFRKERIENEKKLQQSRRENRQLMEVNRDLQEKISDLKNKSRIEKEDKMDNRRLSLDQRHKLEDRYSNHLNTGHLNTEFIRIQDSMCVGYSNGQFM